MGLPEVKLASLGSVLYEKYSCPDHDTIEALNFNPQLIK